jgi:hypothetical protein
MVSRKSLRFGMELRAFKFYSLQFCQFYTFIFGRPDFGRSFTLPVWLNLFKVLVTFDLEIGCRLGWISLKSVITSA